VAYVVVCAVLLTFLRTRVQVTKKKKKKKKKKSSTKKKKKKKSWILLVIGNVDQCNNDKKMNTDMMHAHA
jgi:hypothetical protein